MKISEHTYVTFIGIIACINSKAKVEGLAHDDLLELILVQINNNSQKMITSICGMK